MTSSWQRNRLLAAAAVCLLIVTALGVFVHVGWPPLEDVDRDFGTPAEAWSLQHHAAVAILIAIEVLFGTLGTIGYVLVLVGVLWARGRRRAIVWTVAVMVATSVTTTVMKLLFRRERPHWDDSVHTLTSFSFPSGHASGIASGMGVVMVLAALYVDRPAVRQTVFAVAGVLVPLVGADRILLGVHNLSDVLAGYAVAGFWLFAMLAVHPPERVPSIALRDHAVRQRTPATPPAG